jgi:transcriptional regulator with XRE-family HTH domain
MAPFVKNLRKRAEELGLSHAEAARRAGLSETRYGNYVTGQREPDFATLVRIASVLVTTPNELLGVGAEQPSSSLQQLQNRLAAAGTALSEADLEVLVIQAEAIVIARAANDHLALPQDLT